MTPPNVPETPSTTPAPGSGGTIPSSSVDNTKAILTLVFGILSLICCGFITGIPAFFIGRSELKAIDEGRSAESNRNLTKVGYILGIVGTVLSCLGALAYGAIIALAIFSGQSTPNTF